MEKTIFRMGNIILDNISVKKNLVEYKVSYSPKLKNFFNSDIFWVEYDQDMTNIPESILSIPFIGNFLAFSWLTNSVLWVKETDKTFYNAISRIKNSYQELYPYFKLKGRFVSAKIIDNDPQQTDTNRTIILFSGGLDAHTSYIRNKNTNPILCNIQGWYNNPKDINKVAEADFTDISSFANKQNINHSFVKSNFAQILSMNKIDKEYKNKIKDSYWHGFIHSMAFISLSIPIAFLNKISKIIIASSFTIGDSQICASYPTTDNEFKYAQSGHIIHDAFELNRQDKIKILVSHQKNTLNPYPIRVCSFNDYNCCKCEKCFRTILGLIAENANINNFGFYINDNLRHYWENIINSNIALMGFNSEKIIYWPHIKKRMYENYPYMNKEYQEFVNWFLNFDFDKEKKRGVIKYRIKNFFPILKRKLCNRFTK